MRSDLSNISLLVESVNDVVVVTVVVVFQV